MAKVGPPLSPKAILVMRDAFLDAFASRGLVYLALRDVGAPRGQYDAWRKDPEFLEALEEAKLVYADRLEHELLTRAVEGTEKGVWYKGQRVGSETETHDSLLLAAVRARKPEYREGRDTNVHVGDVNTVNITADAIIQALLTNAQG